jgi:hypothetical protein
MTHEKKCQTCNFFHPTKMTAGGNCTWLNVARPAAFRGFIHPYTTPENGRDCPTYDARAFVVEEQSGGDVEMKIDQQLKRMGYPVEGTS